MTAYLRIENPGVVPIEGFTVLGVSMANTSSNRGIVGQFGSGSKHSVAVLLRNEISPIVFAGTLKMEFSTRPQTVSDGIASKDFGRVVVKFGGSDPITGASKSSTDVLGFVLSYGEKDWTESSLALREFVSNAIDRSIREVGDWSGVKIEIVSESQVRAKAGYTRVFVELTPEVLEFYNNLGKWFLHFSEPESLSKAILPKANRNLGDRKAAVIYRRGVRVREFESSDTESLFDYNLDNLAIDESRKASDWDVKHHSGKALSNADSKTLAILFEKLLSTETSYWEFGFDSLQPAYFDSTEAIENRKKAWQAAFESIAGEQSVLATRATANQLERKGYKPVLAPENLISAAGLYGVKTSSSVLSADELVGREITKATADAQAAVDYIWDLIEEIGLTNGKDIPEVRSFSSILDAGVMLNGYYRDQTVYINRDLAGDAFLVAGSKAISNRLLKVALEEVAHYATNGATDSSRDFQDYVLEVAVRLARRGEFLSSNHGQRESAIIV